jgi:hypothetical protein
MAALVSASAAREIGAVVAVSRDSTAVVSGGVASRASKRWPASERPI